MIVNRKLRSVLQGTIQSQHRSFSAGTKSFFFNVHKEKETLY